MLPILLSVGIEKEAAYKMINQYDLNVIRDGIKLLNASSKEIHNRTGWLLDACKGKWSNGELEKQKQRVARDRKETRERELRKN